MAALAVDIRGLTKSYRKFVLGPLDLAVPVGAIYGLVGANGAGKTTTLDLILGMGVQDAGSVTVLGLDHVRDEIAMKRRVGYVSPDLDFQAWGRVGRAIQFVRGFHPTWDQAYCERLLGAFGLGVRDRILSLSFGNRIKLSLTLAMAWRPALLVLDEPTVGLDAISKQQVFAELLSAVSEGDRTVLISSHGLGDIERFADHIGLIRSGKMLFEGATDEVIDRFRLVDLVVSNGLDLSGRPGIAVQQQDGNRRRVLLDRSQASVEWMVAHGAKEVTESPMTLEDLVIALGRN
jgi:ABC-2 type transport system ATP-binding protein